MKKTAFVFPGQGSQCAGMGKSLYDNYSRVRSLFNTGSEALGRDLAKLCFNADADTLGETINSQPAIFAVSLAACAVLNAGGVSAAGVCGFSLGEVGALTHAGVLDTETGFRVIGMRAACMQEAANESCGGMCAVIGLEAERVEEICAATPGYVIPVNYNCPKQTVIAGEEAALTIAAAECIRQKALKAVRLKVNAAFHSKLMQRAADKLQNGLAGISASPAGIPVYSCCQNAVMTDFTDMPDYMRKQMVSPVRFENVIRQMIADGYNEFIEVGTGCVLAGLIKRISRDVTVLHASDAESIEKCIL